MPLRALIVDDEPLARRRLARLLKDEPGVRVVGEASDGESAVAALGRLRPDLLLLDVRLPGMDGLAVLDALGAARRPAVVFVTAYDQYAVDAFEREAVDYVLKPVAGLRLRAAVARAAGRQRRSRPGELERGLKRGRGVFVRTENIEWIEAAGNAVNLHVGAVVHRVRGPLTRLLDRLDRQRFRRVSRGAVVNVDHVKEIQPWFHGDAVAVVDSGRRIRVSRRYRHELG